MSEIPALTGKEVVKILKKAGFTILRQKGSHVILRHIPTGKTTVVPVHAGKTIKKGLLRAIVEHDAALNMQEFLKFR